MSQQDSKKTSKTPTSSAAKTIAREVCDFVHTTLAILPDEKGIETIVIRALSEQQEDTKAALLESETPQPHSDLPREEPGDAQPTIRKYHPNPEINAGIIQQAIEAEIFDLDAGYPARWWSCPKCESSHHRGHFGNLGNHRCLRCGYCGPEGTMHINDPRLYLAKPVAALSESGAHREQESSLGEKH